MKPTRIAKSGFVRLVLATVLLTAGIASAQNFSYYYGTVPQTGLGSGTTTTTPGAYTEGVQARPADFSNRQWDELTNEVVSLTGDAVTASGPNTNENTHYHSQLWDLGTGWGQDHDGDFGMRERITSVTFYFYIESLQPDDSNRDYQLFYGDEGTNGAPIPGTAFTLSHPGDVGGYYGISIPVDVFTSGASFSIGALGDPIFPRSLMNASADTAVFGQQPGFAVTTVLEPIPEPSAALLGALGGLAFLRRRRS